MHKKSIIVPILAVIIIISGVMASGGLFPDTPAFPRIPTSPGTIGHILYNFFEADGTAKNTQYLSGVSSTGYLQNNNCTDPINNKWTGVDNNGRGICGNGGAVLAGIAKFTEIAGAVEVLKYGTSTWTPANTTDFLYPGDYIRTDSSSTGTIQFVQDDSIIRLFTDTTLELRIGDLDGNSVAEAILSDGRLWGRILSSTGVNLGGGGVVTGVRGTSVDVFKTGIQYTISVTDSVNPVNVLKKEDGMPITSVKDGASTIPNLDFGKGTRFIYNDGDIHNIKKITDDKNNFYVDPWFRKNTRLDAKYMANLVETYGNSMALASKKTRLISELDTTIEPNNTGTLVKLLSDYPALVANIIPIVNTLDEENNFGGENSDLRNMRKAKRFECKAKEKTYFPGLDSIANGCAGSWNTLAITDFTGMSTGALFGKNNNWNYDVVGPWNNAPTNSGEYILYTGSVLNALNKNIKITVNKSDLLRYTGSTFNLLSINGGTNQGLRLQSGKFYYGRVATGEIYMYPGQSGDPCNTSLNGLSAMITQIDIVLFKNTKFELQHNGLLIPGCISTLGTANLTGPTQLMFGAKNSSVGQWQGPIHKIEIINPY